MNFVEYCIYTKNYSALNTMGEYTKQFGFLDRVRSTASNLGNRLSTAATGLKDRVNSLDLGNKLSNATKTIGRTAQGLKNKAMNVTGISGLMNARNTLKKRMGMSDSDIMKNLMSKEGRSKMAHGILTAKKAADNLNEVRQNDYFIDAYRGDNRNEAIATQKGINRRVDALNDYLKGNLQRKKVEKRKQIIDDSNDLLGNDYTLMNALNKDVVNANKPATLKMKV